MTSFVQKSVSGSSLHYLYMLLGQDHRGFKIGVSVDPMRRAKTLGKAFDLGQSLQIGYSRAAAYRRERYLHEIYRDFAIHPDAIGPARMGDGRSEWFLIDCFPACEKVFKRAAAFDPEARTNVEVIRPAQRPANDWLDECIELINDPLFTARLLSSYK